MADNFRFAQLQPFSISGSGATAGDTSLTLKSMTDIDGNALSMSTDFGSIGFGTLEPGSGTQEEQICFTGLVNNANGTTTLTGVSNVSFVYPYTRTSGLSKTHAGSVTFVISNTSGFYDELTSKADDETITGTWTFTNPNYPRMDTDTPYPTDNEQLATKAYADSLTFAGAPNATTTQKGIVELATQAEVDAGTATGGTGASLVPTPALLRSRLLSDYKVDTGAANAYVITPSPAITAYTTGQIFSFKAVNANTTASTLNVNALGVKTIKKLGGTDLASGDIAAGQIVLVEYDGTNFQMLQPVANTPATAAQVAALAKFGGNGADGALSISSGTTTIDCGGASYVEKNYTSISITGTAKLAFTNSNSTTGTTVALRSQGNVTITSSSGSVIDLSDMGGGLGTAGNVATSATVSGSVGGGGGGASGGKGNSGSNIGIAGGAGQIQVPGQGGAATPMLSPFIRIAYPGGNGTAGSAGSGGATAGAGGRGAGGLYIECGGAYNFTSGTMLASGTVGTNGGAGGGGGTGGGGGGGGGGGSILVLYASLTANSGTYTVAAGGNGSGGSGTSSGGDGGSGGAGSHKEAINTYFI